MGFVRLHRLAWPRALEKHRSCDIPAGRCGFGKVFLFQQFAGLKVDGLFGHRHDMDTLGILVAWNLYVRLMLALKLMGRQEASMPFTGFMRPGWAAQNLWLRLSVSRKQKVGSMFRAYSASP